MALFILPKIKHILDRRVDANIISLETVNKSDTESWGFHGKFNKAWCGNLE